LIAIPPVSNLNHYFFGVSLDVNSLAKNGWPWQCRWRSTGDALLLDYVSKAALRETSPLFHKSQPMPPRRLRFF
jgi:hypothetical protein